jgi:uncharacterized protein (TIGR03000 family)
MRLLSHNRLLQAALVATGIVALASTDALAWGHKRASYGSYGSSGSSAGYGSSSASYGSYSSYGSSGSSASYSTYYGSSSSASYSSSGSSASYSSSSGSSGGGPGLFARWHARKAARKAAASSGSSGSHGSYASSGSSGSYSGYGSSGSSGSSGGYSTPMYYETPAEGAPVNGVPMEPQPAAPEVSAAIRVNVPTDAVVFVNDRPTTSTGAERSFVSRGLSSGRTYAYQLRVEFTRDGEQVVENKLVRLRAGESIDLSFGAGEQVAAEAAPATDLTLHVPAEARVTLAGAATTTAGESRTYTTTSLAAGQEWDGYVVRVELERDGQTIVKEKSLTIVGGESYELSFDFADATTVASLN